jgi:hypothetical protein
MLANFGQCPFVYAGANGGRVPDPACPRLAPGPSSGPSIIDDSGDLFSIGRIDSRWYDDGGGDDTAAADTTTASFSSSSFFFPRSGSCVGRSQHRRHHHHHPPHPPHHLRPASVAAPPPIIVASSSELDSDLFEIVLGHSRHNHLDVPN